MSGRGTVCGGRARRCAVLCAAVVVVLLTEAPTAGAQTAFTARCSVEQVYVTGLAPSAEMALLDPSGKTIATE